MVANSRDLFRSSPPSSRFSAGNVLPLDSRSAVALRASVRSYDRKDKGTVRTPAALR
jgi:hypothetical protein